MAKIFYSKFAVHKTPYCVWDWNLRQREAEFIDYFDPGYLEFVADVFSQLLKDDIERHSAMALRTYYSQALETLFALLCAFAQAHDCISGWFLRYRVKELRDAVRDIQEGRPVLNTLPVECVSWQTLSEHINDFAMDDAARLAAAQERFANLWARLAHDFLDDTRMNEFNSIKHGLRVKSGGFNISLCPDDGTGKPDLEKALLPMSGSKHGSRFLEWEPLPHRHHFRILSRSVNWDPECMAHGIRLAAVSIRNIVSCVKVLHGADPASVQLRLPRDDYFESHWKKTEGIFITSLGEDVPIPVDAITPFTGDEILAAYAEQLGDDSEDFEGDNGGCAGAASPLHSPRQP